jgi:hypothetical protein
VAEASEALGISVEAVRGRIKRGTVEHERTPEGVYVFIDTDQPPTGHDQPSDQSRPDAAGALVEELRDRIAFLEGQLRRRDEEIGRRDAVLLNMTEAMKALNPPREAQSREEASESPESPGPSDAPPEAGREVQEATERQEERSWWRRMFG